MQGKISQQKVIQTISLNYRVVMTFSQAVGVVIVLMVTKEMMHFIEILMKIYCLEILEMIVQLAWFLHEILQMDQIIFMESILLMPKEKM